MEEWNTKHVVTVAISVVGGLLLILGLVFMGFETAHENNIKSRILWQECLKHNPVANCKVSIDGGNRQ